MRILGIDPGLRVTGFGVIDLKNHKLEYVTSGCIRSGTGELSQRLRIIFEGMSDIVKNHRLDHMVIEKVFLNTRTVTSVLVYFLFRI